MLDTIVDTLLEMITGGTRPIRIFLFGGAFLALLTIIALGNALGMTSIGESFEWPNVLYVAASILFGFGVSYGIVHVADAIKQRREGTRRL